MLSPHVKPLIIKTFLFVFFVQEQKNSRKNQQEDEDRREKPVKIDRLQGVAHGPPSIRT
jgi:hypothetical protein